MSQSYADEIREQLLMKEAEIKQLREKFERAQAKEARPQDKYTIISGAPRHDGNAVNARASIPRSKSTASHSVMAPRMIVWLPARPCLDSLT